MTIQVSIFPQYQRRAAKILPKLEQEGFDFLLQHQQDHYTELAEARIVVNTNQTGTGKTLASLLHLLRPEMRQAGADTLMIAPTNELIAQHTEDVREFVASHHLPHLTIQVNAAVITKLVTINKSWRRGEAFYNLLRNPRDPKIAPHLEPDISVLNVRSPVILITNPDLFYYVLQGSFGRLDSRNLTTELIGKFRYVIIDEFHYYTPKQAAAFFLYVSLLAKFGFFDEGRRMSFLTATPETEVEIFFQNLNSLGIRVSHVLPQPVDAGDPSATMSTASVNLEFAASDEGIERIISDQADRIRKYIGQGRDVAIISSSLADISATAGCFRKDEYQTITGAVAAAFRRAATRSKLILATPTVDIGYNFARPGKNRQGLDDIYFTALYSDEFWQRLGRAGRVVKKADQSVTSNAVSVISSEAYEKLQSLQIDRCSLERKDLEQKLRDGEVFKPRAYFWDYVASEGFFENGQALLKFREVFTVQERHRIDEVYEFLAKILGAHKAPSWGKLQGRLWRYRSLEKEKRSIDNRKPELPSPLLREFASENAKRRQIQEQWEETSEEKIEHDAKAYLESDLTALREHLRINSVSCKQYSRFVHREYAAVAGIFSFRDSFSGIPIVAYDKQCVFHPKQHVARYDALHLMKNCELYVYPSRKQFISEMEKAGILDQAGDWVDEESPIFVRIDGLRERSKRLRFQLQLTVENLDVFQKLDTDCVRAFDGLKIGFTVGEGANRSPFPVDPNLERILADQFIPMVVFSSKTRAILFKRIRAAGFFTTEMSVSDGDKTKQFQALLGTAAYFVARRTFGLRSALERYEGFHIC